MQFFFSWRPYRKPFFKLSSQPGENLYFFQSSKNQGTQASGFQANQFPQHWGYTVSSETSPKI